MHTVPALADVPKNKLPWADAHGFVPLGSALKRVLDIASSTVWTVPLSWNEPVVRLMGLIMWLTRGGKNS